jgi:hypothetical protein
MDERDDARTAKDTPAPHAPDALGASERERRAARGAHGRGRRPLHAEETAPGERGDAPYGDSEPGPRVERPGT